MVYAEQMINLKHILYSSLLMLIAGCSIEPLYKHDFESSSASSSNNIDIDVIAGRDGQKLRIYLTNAFRDIDISNNKYRLSIKLSKHEKTFAFSEKGNAKRVLFVYDAHVKLKDNENKIIMSKTISASACYNISSSRGEAILSLYGRHNEPLIKELSARIFENIRMAVK